MRAAPRRAVTGAGVVCRLAESAEAFELAARAAANERWSAICQSAVGRGRRSVAAMPTRG
jgi:hypothetical protein